MGSTQGMHSDDLTSWGSLVNEHLHLLVFDAIYCCQCLAGFGDLEQKQAEHMIVGQLIHQL